MPRSRNIPADHIGAHHDHGRCLIDGPECPYLTGRHLSHVLGGSPAERAFDVLANAHRCEAPPMCSHCEMATDVLAGALAGMAL